MIPNEFSKVYDGVGKTLDYFADKNQKKYYIISALAMLSYKLLIDIVYVSIVTKEFFTRYYADFNLVFYFTGLFAIFILIIPIIYLYLQNSLSSIIVVILNLIWFIPLTTMYGFSNLQSYTFALSVFYWGVFVICQIKIPIFEAKIISSKKFIKLMRVVFLGIGVLISIAVIYTWAAYADFRLQLSLFEEVYEVREESKTYEVPLLISFLLNFSTIVLPLMLVFLMDKKKYFFSIIIFFVIFLDFSIGAHKSTLFYGILAIAGYMFYRRERINFFSFGLSIIAIISIVIYFVTNNYTLVTLLFRRAMFVPVALTEDYVNFFSQNSHNIFIRSLESMSNLGLEPVYQAPYTEIVGLYNATGANANNGMVSDAFAQLGLVGVVIYPVILVIILRVIDFFGNNADRRLSIFVVINIVIMLVSTGWTSFVLSAELFVICGILYWFTVNNKEDENEI